MRKIQIYTDGGCSPNPGAGGWGFVILEDEEENLLKFGGDTDTTNNRMELTAVIKALDEFIDPLDASIFSDSKYVVNGINSWLKNWIRNDFKAHSQNKNDKIKNEDLWRLIWDYKQSHHIKAYWIRGHSGIPMNELADQLATKGRLKALDVESPDITSIHNEDSDISIYKHNRNDKDWLRLIKYLSKNKWDYTISE